MHLATFSAYSPASGNAKRATGLLLPARHVERIRARFGDQPKLIARGWVCDSELEIELTPDAEGRSLTLHSRSTGVHYLRIDRTGVRTGKEPEAPPLSDDDDLSLNNLDLVEREGRLFVVSTERTIGRRAQKRSRGAIPSAPPWREALLTGTLTEAKEMLTIAEAKRRLAATFGVAPEDVQITIRG